MNEPFHDPAASYLRSEDADRYFRHHEGGFWRRRRSAAETAFCARGLDELIRRTGPAETLIDLPCGTGRMFEMLAHRARTITAIDAAPPMLELARVRRIPSRTDPITCLHARAESLPLPDASVDVVFCHRLLHHFKERDRRQAIMNELCRVARRGLLLTFWSTGNLRSARESQRIARGEARRRFCVDPAEFVDDLAACRFETAFVRYKLKYWSPLALIGAVARR